MYGIEQKLKIIGYAERRGRPPVTMPLMSKQGR